jgi:hypothetical protein
MHDRIPRVRGGEQHAQLRSQAPGLIGELPSVHARQADVREEKPNASVLLERGSVAQLFPQGRTAI